MHVTIGRKHSKIGWFLGLHYHQVEVLVIFSEEELAAIKKADLQGYTVLTRHEYFPPYEGNSASWDLHRNFRVHGLIDAHRRKQPVTVFYSTRQPDADEAEEELRENLKKLKAQIESAAKPRPEKDSYEL